MLSSVERVLTRRAVLIAGLIAVVLNLILPQEEDPNGEDDDVIERGIEREVIEVVPRGNDEKKL